MKRRKFLSSLPMVMKGAQVLFGQSGVSQTLDQLNGYYGLSEDLYVEEQTLSDPPHYPLWWTNSGAFFFVKDKIGRTFAGDLDDANRWKKLYADGSRNSNNPIDTDNGLHPQNLFRLVTRTTWKDFRQEAYFRILRVNLSNSPNRDASNGFLLFSRYQDSDNLYYIGIRVDGTIVIKKKIRGIYYTLGQNPISEYRGTYNRILSPNLVPLNKWIGIRSVTRTLEDGRVVIQAFWDADVAGNWKLLAEVADNGVGGAPILQPGFAGIRTDFMDAEFCRYSLKEGE